MTGNSKDTRFKKVDEIVSCLMKFPEGRVANFSISFGAFAAADYDLIGSRGRIRLEKAYEFSRPMTLKIYEERKIITKKYPKRDQFRPEILYFSECIQKKKKPEPSGEEGLADIKIIEAFLLSIDLGSPIRLDEFSKKIRPSETQKITRPALARPKLFNAVDPIGIKQ
jgi:predicted dehydrogenase